MDLSERRQIDVATSMAKVRERARPWRSILALVVAAAGGIAAEISGVKGWSHLYAAGLSQPQRILYICGAAAFLVFGLAAALGLSSRAGARSQQLIGQAHAGILRYVLVLVGVFAVLTISLAIAHIDVKQLLVSGAVVGVLLGIAAQQSLANLFAGLVLLFAHPFRVGDRVRLRAGALSGPVDGIVIDLSLAYVRLDTEEGPLLVPNSQALAAAVLLMPDGPGASLAVSGGPASSPAGPDSPDGPASPASSPAGTDSLAVSASPASGPADTNSPAVSASPASSPAGPDSPAVPGGPASGPVGTDSPDGPARPASGSTLPARPGPG